MNLMRIKNFFAPFVNTFVTFVVKFGFFNHRGHKGLTKGTKGFHVATAIVLALALVVGAFGSTLPSVQPSKVSVDAARLAYIDEAVNDAIANKEMPGAVVLVARKGGVVWRKAYGSRPLGPQREGREAGHTSG